MENFKLEDLKMMDTDQLSALGASIREEIIKSVSLNGGHLSSNLGVVDLTIALHKVFDSPHDKFIFDVSHQTYTHKIITGRSEGFKHLRQLDGVSGFSKCSESIHDVFEAGHSSTSISAGLGFLEAKKSGKDIGEVIAIIGDASVTNGLAFEALNYLGANPDQKMIIILNDNDMGISKNVGALARQFNKIRSRGKFKFLRKITPNGIKRMLKSYAYRQNIFEALGIHYFEGIDGHNYNDLIKYLEFAKSAKESVLLHIKTKKGYGYKYSEEDASGYWHHVGKFDIVTGLPLKEDHFPIFGEEIANHLINLIDNGFDNLRVITPAMSLGSGLTTIARKYPEHFIDVGIAEENAVVMASAMAKEGLNPVVFIYSTFLQRAYDEILHDVGRTNAHVVFMIDRAGIVDGDGDTHQGIYDVAFLQTIPRIEVLTPLNINDALIALDYALKVNHPVAIRYAKKCLVDIEKEDTSINKYQIIKAGSKVMFISYGNLIEEIYKDIKDNPDYGLINVTNLSSIDESLIKDLAYKKINIITYEEVIKNNSLGQQILMMINDKEIPINIKTYALPNNYIGTGTRVELLNKYLPSVNSIISEGPFKGK